MPIEPIIMLPAPPANLDELNATLGPFTLEFDPFSNARGAWPESAVTGWQGLDPATHRVTTMMCRAAMACAVGLCRVMRAGPEGCVPSMAAAEALGLTSDGGWASGNLVGPGGTAARTLRERTLARLAPEPECTCGAWWRRDPALEACPVRTYESVTRTQYFLYAWFTEGPRYTEDGVLLWHKERGRLPILRAGRAS